MWGDLWQTIGTCSHYLASLQKLGLTVELIYYKRLVPSIKLCGKKKKSQEMAFKN